MTGEVPRNRDRAIIVADSTVSENQISGAITQLKALTLVKIIGVVKCFDTVDIVGLNAQSMISTNDIIDRLRDIQSRRQK